MSEHDDEPKRRPGRPRLDAADRSIPVSVAVPARQHDALCRAALREGVSVATIIRRALSKATTPAKP